MINIDITLFIQVVNFLVSLAIINYLIIRPIRANIAKRRGIVEGFEGEASALSADAAHRLEAYEARLAEVRLQMGGMRADAKKAGDVEAHARLDDAAEDARGIRRQAAERLQEESMSAQKQLQNRVADFAQLALGKVLN